jgi:hypothetical protein
MMCSRCADRLPKAYRHQPPRPEANDHGQGPVPFKVTIDDALPPFFHS